MPLVSEMSKAWYGMRGVIFGFSQTKVDKCEKVMTIYLAFYLKMGWNKNVNSVRNLGGTSDNVNIATTPVNLPK